jgi:hypothetical protein
MFKRRDDLSLVRNDLSIMMTSLMRIDAKLNDIHAALIHEDEDDDEADE